MIWGVHRSGTSVLADMLYRLGWSVGDVNLTATVENPRGFFENRRLLEINEALLIAIGQRWDNWAAAAPSVAFELPAVEPIRNRAREMIETLSFDTKPWLLKDPRCASLAGFWVPILNQVAEPISHIIALREPRHVATSLFARAVAKPEAYPTLHRKEAAHILWLSQMSRLLRALDGKDTVIIEFSTIVSDPKVAFKRLVDACGGSPDPSVSVEECADTFSNDYVRSESDIRESNGPWSERASALHEALKNGEPTEELLLEIDRAMANLAPLSALLEALPNSGVEWF